MSENKALENKPTTLNAILSDSIVRKRFEDILKDRAPGFISSILSLYNASEQLREAEPGSILQAAVIAATLDLPINSNLGFAFIIPYGKKAQFQMGWKGFVQLAIRTGNYKTIHATEVYKDEIARWDPLTGVFESTPPEMHKLRNKGDFRDVVGYMAYFKMQNGFEKTLYMTDTQLVEHGKKYSKSFTTGMWTLNPHVMKIKTVIKLLLSKYGLLSVQMEKAMEVDQGVVDTTGNISYDDRPVEEPVVSKPSGADKLINDDQVKLLYSRIDKSGIDRDEVKRYFKDTFKKEHYTEMTVEELSKMIKWVEQDPESQA